MSTRRPSTLRRYAPLAFFPLIGLWLTACVPELGVGEEFIDDPHHDYDEDGFTELEGDCNDNNEEMNPDSIWWSDNDGDGYGNSAASITGCAQPPRTVVGVYVDEAGEVPNSAFSDCDDTNALVNPGAVEVCDGIDNDCDEAVDPEGTTGEANFYLDVDQDGFGSEIATVVDCEDALPEGYVPAKDINGDGTLDFDCDDYEAARFPGNPEICDGLDNDCDFLSDDEDGDVANDAITWHRDEDGDGFGGFNTSLILIQCDDPTIAGVAYALNDTDCDDTDSTINPGVLEVCDNIDKNCDGVNDDDLKQTYYTDSDDDGFGDPADYKVRCNQPSDTSVDNTDCDDSDATINPNVIEICDDIDNNCDGLIDGSDAADLQPFFPDGDQDGYGDGSATAEYHCEAPSDYTSNASDCNDQLPNVNPAGTESCVTDYDDDCDGDTNDLNADACLEFYIDGDGDGFGGGSAKCRCEAKGNYTETTPGDCDDANDAVRPNVVETCDTPYDDNCDGDTNDVNALACTAFFWDTDGDGYGDGSVSQCTCDDGGADAWVSKSGDCDESTSAISPDAQELCTPEGDTPVDEDCDGQTDEASAIDALTWYADVDGDGFGDAADILIACAQPVGYIADATDCDDNRDQVNPAADEDCATTYDDDCDTDDNNNDVDAIGCSDFYADGDSDDYGVGAAVCTCTATATHTATVAEDCDDVTDTINPGITETCATAYDDNCDGDENDQGATACSDYWADTDGDGYGTGTSLCLCVEEGLYEATADGDCDDTTAVVNPAATEVCAGVGEPEVDENCDSFEDDASAIDALTWYADIDGDGYGDPGAMLLACAEPDDYVGNASDCDDGRESVKPGATETCATGFDDDCDGDENDEDATGCLDFWEDADGDDYGVGASVCLCEASATYGASEGGDCDDTLDVVNPGETETCATAADDDCSGSDNDEDAINCIDYFSDADGDGYGIGVVDDDSICLCQPTGTDTFDATIGGDCNDDITQNGVTINPGATELCDTVDNDCDGDTDEEDAADATLFYRDVDGDGYGTDTDTKTACAPPAGYANPDFDEDGSDDIDCDDGREVVNPGATETCATGFDDDCDGDNNDEDATGCDDWYYDGDFDAHGTSDSQCLCSPAGFYTAGTDDDCDDAEYYRNPSATETCATAFDDDCDVDDDANEDGALECTTYYFDEDGDGYGLIGSTECRCTAESPFDAPLGADCNDDPAAGGYDQNPGLGNCGLVGTISTGDAVAEIVGAYDDFVVGDFNGDGWADLAVGQSTYDTLYTNPGAVFITYGPLTGPFETGSSHNANVVFSPEEYNAQAGHELAVGDFDGDGKDDLVIGGLEKTWRVHGPFAGAMNAGDAVQVIGFGSLALDIWEDWDSGLPAFSVGEGFYTPPGYAWTDVVPGKLARGALNPGGEQQWARVLDGAVELLDNAAVVNRATHQGIAAGYSHTCALSTSGEAVCWGWDNFGQSTPPANGLSYQAIAAGGEHTCAISTSGEAVCWGSDGHGQSTPPANGLSYQAIAAGREHTCALSTSGEAVCWGNDGHGQSSPPANGLSYQAIAAGGFHTCALSTTGDAVCWGRDSNGQSSPPANGLSYQAIAAGEDHTCALSTSGEAVCWGFDSYGQSSPPANGLSYQAIAAGGSHTCALTDSGDSVCWGSDSFGQSSPPANGLSYQAIAVGAYHTCAISTFGAAVCWGFDSSGQSSPPSPYPPLAWTTDIDMDSATIGEFTGDAYLDLVIGDKDLSTSGDDPESGPWSISAHGKIWVIPGSASGFVGEYDPEIDATHTITGTENNAQAGLDLINAGDINGDGVDDLISNQRLYYGPLAVGDTAAESFDAEFPSGDVRPAGDVNDDGYDDLFVGDYLYLGQPN